MAYELLTSVENCFVTIPDEVDATRLHMDDLWLQRLSRVSLLGTTIVRDARTEEQILADGHEGRSHTHWDDRDRKPPSNLTPVNFEDEPEEDPFEGIAEIPPLSGVELTDVQRTRHAHSRPHVTIVVDRHEIERRIADIRDTDTRTTHYAGYLNQALVDGLVQARSEHLSPYNMPKGERWALGGAIAAYAPAVVLPVAELGPLGALVGVAAWLAGHNAVRAMLGKREGVPLTETCYGVLPGVHVERFFVPFGALARVRPIVKALQ